MLHGVEYLFEGTIVGSVVFAAYGVISQEFLVVGFSLVYGFLTVAIYMAGLRRGWFDR